MNDHPQQHAAAKRVLSEADEVVLTLPALCEFAWVLRSVYQQPAAAIAESILALAFAPNVRAPIPTIEEGIAALEAGADFADGVIAYDGAWNGGGTFVSFDRKAVKALKVRGHDAQLIKTA